MRTRMLAASALVTVFVLAGCTGEATINPTSPPSAIPTPSTSTEPSIQLTPEMPLIPGEQWIPQGEVDTLATGLAAPWSVVPLADGTAFISERDSGIIRYLADDGELHELGTVPGVVSGGEAGLHGLAVTEREGEQWLYAYFGAADDNRVVRMRVASGPSAASPSSVPVVDEPIVVFSGIPHAQTHNGGRIAFGPDGFLYVATGDAGDRDASQNPDALAGKILRLTPDGDPAPGNPFGTAVYSLGHRNVQGLAWTSDGTMWASEFGQNRIDELNRIEAGGNYGWPLYEGVARADGFIDPLATWTTDEASPSGLAAIGDTLFMAALRGQTLWVIETADGAVVRRQQPMDVTPPSRLRDAVAGPADTLWVLTNNTDGRGTPHESDDRLLSIPVVRAQ